jgi:hypothetical protein
MAVKQLGGMGAPTVRGWGGDFQGLVARVGPCFGRRDLRGRAAGYLRGLLGRVERKNGWQVAEYLGDAKPYGVQRLLGRARWDAGAVRDEARRYAAEHLLAPGDGGGVLAVDETGFLKKGGKSAGVQRQYGGSTAARPGASRTARWACSWRCRVRGGGRWSTGSCTCPRAGAATRPGARRRACLRAWSSPPSRRWRCGCSTAPSRRG